MDDFASYTGSAKKQETKTAEEWTEEAKKIASRYDGRGEGDIMKEIYARALEGKRNGTLTNEQIDAFYRQFSPMLNAIQRKKLQKLVAQLKSM